MFGAWVTRTFDSLSNPQFRVLWAGTLIATLAYMMMFVVISVVAFDLAGTNSAVGLVMLGVGLSMLLVAPYGGVVADRVNRRRLIIVAQGAGALVLFLTGFLVIADLLTLELLAVLTLGLALSQAFAMPARQALVGEIVSPKLLPNAVALSQLAHTLGQPISPMVAGILLKTVVGAGGIYILMGSLVTVGALSVVMIGTAPGAATTVRRAVHTEMRDGLRQVWNNPQVRVLLLLLIGVVALGMVYRIALPAFLDRELGRDPSDMGLLLLVNGAAGGVVSLLLAGMAGGRWAWPLILLMTAVLGAGYVLLAEAQSFGVAIASMLLMGPGLQGPLLLGQAQIMMNVDPAYYGRVMSLTMVAFGAQALIGLPVGVLADGIGERETFFVLGMATFAVAGLGTLAWVRLRRAGETGRAAVAAGAGASGEVEGRLLPPAP
ncbi:MAG: MFS family permease [Chloroflexi bacterium]|nr:MAG: MFS family permease [Chloroflexota bacterium]